MDILNLSFATNYFNRLSTCKIEYIVWHPVQQYAIVVIHWHVELSEKGCMNVFCILGFYLRLN